VTHARNFKFNDSVPKITFGRFSQRNHKKIMPVSINVHHGLMDGYHVGQYLELFEQLINDKLV
jgi:chloramphenicol O-acetyltransferase type A